MRSLSRLFAALTLALPLTLSCTVAPPAAATYRVECAYACPAAALRSSWHEEWSEPDVERLLAELTANCEQDLHAAGCAAPRCLCEVR